MLKQTDFDGKSVSYPIIDIKKVAFYDDFFISLKSNNNIEIESNLKDKTNYYITNSLGVVIKNGQIDQGLNEIYMENAGLYFIFFSNKNESYKFIIQ